MSPRLRSRFVPVSLLPAMAMIFAALAPAPAAAWSREPAINNPVCTASGAQLYPAAASDDAGGMFVAWTDYRGGDADIYLSHLSKSGQLASGWPANGLVVCNAAGDQTSPVVVADGSGGVLLAWQDHRSGGWDIYAQRISASGTIAPGWVTNGTVVGAAAPNGVKDETAPRIVGDGAGGALIVWTLAYAAEDDDIYMTHVTGTGATAPGWFPGGNGVWTTASIQNAPSICSDGAGGAFVVCEDNVSGNFDIRMAHATGAGGMTFADVDVNSGNQFEPIITADGFGGSFVFYNSDANTAYLSPRAPTMLPQSGWGLVTIATYTSASADPVDLLSDGVGGVYLSWKWTQTGSSVPYLVHVGTYGSVGGSWLVGGVQLPYGFSGSGVGARLVSDGSGGVIAVYPAGAAIKACRYLLSGDVPANWGTGVTIGYGNNPTAAVDGRGGVLAAWADLRTGEYDIYADRVEHFGILGDPEPVMAGVKDVLNDQGGQVRVNWLPSYLDADPTNGIYQYVLYRQAPASLAESALRSGRAVALAPEETAARGAITRDGALGTRLASRTGTRYLVIPASAQTFYWEEIATAQARQLAAYSLVASTTGDSIGGSNPYTVFMVEALGTAGGYWFTAPDSGYSVDDLAPAAPTAFSGTYVPGTGTLLQWAPNTESDLAGYRLYKSSFASFTPGPSNLVAVVTGTNCTDPSLAPGYYKLSAVDVHGNESLFATTLPSGVAAVDGDVPAQLFLAPVAPNPIHGEAVLHYGLPRAADVKLAIYDASGRSVRVLAQGTSPAGRYAVRWDGREADGRSVSSGVYFARLQTGGQVITRRLVTMR